MMKSTQVSPDLSISFEDAGQGTPLVFLHAFPLSSEMWNDQIQAFADEYRILCPNSRGINGTSAFDDTPTIDRLAHDLALWLRKLNIQEKVVLCGLSMGGYVALEFARAYPDKLRALILADTRHDIDSPEAKKARDEMIEFASHHDGQGIVQKMLPKLLAPESVEVQPEVAQRVVEIASANSGEALAKLMSAIRDRRDSTDLLRSISCPVLVVGGASDVPSPPEVMGTMAGLIPEATHVVLNGSGHLSNLEQPEEFNRTLKTFLDGLK